MITQYLAQKFLPAVSPVFHKMSDTELLSIVGWAQKWPVGKVYDTAFEQVFPEKQLKDAKPDFDEWFIASENPRLPIIVREELIRAFRIHMASGRMDVFKTRRSSRTICQTNDVHWFILFVFDSSILVV